MQVTFACVKQGSKYGSHKVNILLDMVARNMPDLSIKRFVCFTDDASGLDTRIDVIETPSDIDGWWAKLYMFKPGHFEDDERVIYLDLDCLIVGDLSALAAYTGPFAILRDFYRPNGLQSAVMAWPGGWGRHIWTEWLKQDCPRLPGGDQEWIERMVPDAVRIQDVLPGVVCSYKLHCMGLRKPPAGSRIVKFHGFPKIEDAPESWVKNLYKIGAGVASDIELYSNLEGDKLRSNVRANSKREIPWLNIAPPHDRSVAIVAGGPSVKSQLGLIKAMADSGVLIWAVNGAAHYLQSNGITVQTHVILDGRPDNIRFIQPISAKAFCIASQCDEAIFDSLSGLPVTLFHSYNSDTEGAIPRDSDKPLTLVASGSTVGLAAMVLAYADGFRRIHLFGYDSSFDEYHHAYPQDLNDADEVIQATVGDRTFKTTPWMAAQVNQWQHCAAELANGGAEIYTHGDGLLQHVAHEMANMQSDGEFKRIDGILWPARDIHCSESVMLNAGDLDEILQYVPGRKVVVQAGGNVGVWPKKLSEHFKTVYTFEPDDMNYACLQDNVPEQNVIKYRAALGAERGKVSLVKDDKNVGAHFVAAGNDIPVFTIDDLELDECNLICLDIEGYEMQALKGAANTIRKHRPVIVAEDKGLSERYGVEEGEIRKWLESEYGYATVAQIGRDVVMAAVTGA